MTHGETGEKKTSIRCASEAFIKIIYESQMAIFITKLSAFFRRHGCPILCLFASMFGRASLTLGKG